MIETIRSWIHRMIFFGLKYSSMITILFLSIFSTITEIFGIGIFIPIYQYMESGSDIASLKESSELWHYIDYIFNFFTVQTTIGALLIIAFILFSLRSFFNYFKGIYLTKLKHLIVKNIRIRLFSKYMKTGTCFQDKIPIGDLSNVINTESMSATLGIIAPLNLVVVTLVATTYFLVLVTISFEMTMVSIIIAFLTIIVAKYWIILSAKSGREVTNSNKVINEFLLRKIGSPRLVRLSNTLNLEEYRFDKLAHKQMNNNIHAFALQLKTEVLVEPLIISFGLLIVYLSLTVLILKIESIALFLIILVRLVPVLKEILMQWQSIQRYLGSIEIVEDRLLSMEKNSEKDTGIKNFYKLKNRVEFLNVTYFYPNSSTPALFDVSLKIPVNKLIAIVGPSGGGKSTLVDLMPKLRRPSSGKILFDDINIELFKNTGIRSAIAYVPQKSQIFNGTISDHIKYGYPNATEIEMKRAAKLAGADDFIRNLSKAYDTNIGEDGGHLSGGQKQRLDIARALIRKASILILDEPTSNLDVDSERGLIDSLSRIIHDTNTTIIVISHNLKTVVKSDIIFVLNNGKIEQTGTHLELLSKELWYSKAWRKATY